ncbi:DUF4381 domain-containing protein [Teredinibacter turnerae]|uniref:DUF4381 domain-containing protein n=1 Tax=Teredinibacter turnerae TaxID=2426 RepID=UPI00037680B8|nr:DUF4381 domain-containing protein [Teredinibacter turnerae]
MNPTNLPATAQQPAAANPADQLLAQLQGPALPDPIGIWPLAPGWWILLVLVIALITGTVVFFVRHRRATAYRRTALSELARIEQSLSGREQLFAVMALLKRTCFTAYPQQRNEIAGLHGLAWLQRLEQHCALSKLSASEREAFAYCFSGEIYRDEPPHADVVSGATHAARFWITHHRRKPIHQTTREASAHVSV